MTSAPSAYCNVIYKQLIKYGETTKIRVHIIGIYVAFDVATSNVFAVFKEEARNADFIDETRARRDFALVTRLLSAIALFSFYVVSTFFHAVHEGLKVRQI